MPAVSIDDYFQFLLREKARCSSGRPEDQAVLAAGGHLYAGVVQTALLKDAKSFDMIVDADDFALHVPGLRRWSVENPDARLCVIFQGSAGRAKDIVDENFGVAQRDGRARFYHTGDADAPGVMVADGRHACQRMPDGRSVVIGFNAAPLQASAFRSFYGAMKAAKPLAPAT